MLNFFNNLNEIFRVFFLTNENGFLKYFEIGLSIVALKYIVYLDSIKIAKLIKPQLFNLDSILTVYLFSLFGCQFIQLMSKTCRF
jgi:hypothetical protein